MSLFTWAAARESKLEKAFWQFHTDNPQVYVVLVKYAREWRRYHSKCSIKLLFERARWEFGTTIQSKDEFKLNNNHHAYYARLIEEREPDLKGIFRMRQQSVQATFGPANATLPPGGHVTP